VKLVILITAQTERTLDISQAWQKDGAPGVTILEGYGFRRLTEKMGWQDDLPLMPSISSLLRQQEISTHVLISAVADEVADKLYATTESLIGSLTLPHNGFMITLDIEKSLGVVFRNVP
jgi:hypothetical protein